MKNMYCALFLSLGIIMGISKVEAGKITLVKPTSGTVGTIITVEGEGYLPSETIRIDLPGQFDAVKTRCSEEGTFSTSFVLGRHPGGENKFVVVGFTSYALDKGTVGVESRISLITPTSGKVGEFVTIEGDGYGVGEKIAISFGANQEIRGILADGQGGFSCVFTTDTQPAGIKKIIVSGIDSKETNTRQYVLQGGIQSVMPTYGYVGTLVTVTGAGFGKEESIQADFGKTGGIVSTASTADGNFSFIFTVDSQSQGRKDILVKGLETGERDEKGFVITPHIELVTPTTGTVGSKITVIATGFGSSEPIRIDLGRTLAAARTESDGEGVVKAEIVVGSQPGKLTRRLAVVGLNTRQISFTDVFTILPTIKLNPTTGEVETSVLVHGEGFPAQEPIRIDFGKVTTIAMVTTDQRNGNFDVWFNVPIHPSGKANIRVIIISSNEVLEESFIVNPRIKLISPSASGGLDDVIVIQGDGFGASEIVQINLGKTENIGEGITDIDGNFIITFKIDAQSGGNKTCTAIGLSSGEQKSSSFVIKPKILISPTSGLVGTTTLIEIKGSGYGVSESIRIDFGKNTKISEPVADNDGAFITNFPVINDTIGEVKVRIIGLQSWSIQTINFMVVEEKKEEEVKPPEGAKEGELKEEGISQEKE